MKRLWAVLFVVVYGGLVPAACTIAVSGRASVFQREAKSDREELLLVQRILEGEGGEAAAVNFLKARGYSDEQVVERIEAAKAARGAK